MKKIGYFGCLLLVAALMLTGCAGSADSISSPTPGTDMMSPGASPMVQSSPMLTTQMPILSDLENGVNAMLGLTTLQDVQQASEEMEDAVEQLSEVDDAYVVAHGDKALVGLKMNSQYQGSVDDRLKKMVLGRVQTIEKGITGVAVTDDPTKVQKIEKLSEMLDDAQDLTQITTEMDSLVKEITLYQE